MGGTFPTFNSLFWVYSRGKKQKAFLGANRSLRDRSNGSLRDHGHLGIHAHLRITFTDRLGITFIDDGGGEGGDDKHTHSTAANQPPPLPDYKVTWLWGGVGGGAW